MVSPMMNNNCFMTPSSSLSPSASISSTGSKNFFDFKKVSVSRRLTQNLYRERRKLSDPVQLKESHSSFVKHWNGEVPVQPINPLCVLQARCNAVTDFDASKPISRVFSLPRRMSHINQLLVDPELMKLRQRYERKIERRRSLSIANYSLAAEKANPAKSAVIEKYAHILTYDKRSLSETICLTKLIEDDIELSTFSIKHDKRVLFAAPPAKRRSMCPDQKPTSILHKEPKNINKDYPLFHMDYATFRAWRTGEAFRLNVDSASKTEKPKPHEAAIRLVKYVIFSCLKQ